MTKHLTSAPRPDALCAWSRGAGCEQPPSLFRLDGHCYYHGKIADGLIGKDKPRGFGSSRLGSLFHG